MRDRGRDGGYKPRMSSLRRFVYIDGYTLYSSVDLWPPQQ